MRREGRHPSGGKDRRPGQYIPKGQTYARPIHALTIPDAAGLGGRRWAGKILLGSIVEMKLASAEPSCWGCGLHKPSLPTGF